MHRASRLALVSFPRAGPSPETVPGKSPLLRELRQALASLHDPAALHSSALARRLSRWQQTEPAGPSLRRLLLESLQTLRPADVPNAGAQSRRAFDLLTRRYVEGDSIAGICGSLGISEREYHRSHNRGLDALTAWIAAYLGAFDPPADALQPRSGLLLAEIHPLAPSPRGNVVQPFTSFFGRETELTALGQRLRVGRLLTLVGPPGVGKTRLSLALAEQVAAEFPDGVWFVPIAAIADEHLVLPAVAETLKLRTTGNRPISDQLADALRERELLLILDNLEQVITAGPAIADLAGRCPTINIVVSSRVPLRVYGEQVIRVRPLPLPRAEQDQPLDELARNDAVSLFADRSTAANEDFALSHDNAGAIAAICHRLSGLPLAIELVAARSRFLTPSDVLAQLASQSNRTGLDLVRADLQDRTPRQQTLEGAIAWSHELLSNDEQTLFRRLAIFAGGCTLQGATAVAGPICRSDIIERLVDSSLLEWQRDAGDEPRLTMLEAIRLYALERLQCSGERELVADRHAAYYLGLGERARPALRQSDQAAWVARLDRERHNLRAARDWLAKRGQVELVLRLASDLHWFWYIRGDWHEAVQWLTGALGATGPASEALRGEVLLWRAHFQWRQGDYMAALDSVQEQRSCIRNVADPTLYCGGLGVEGGVLASQGEYARACLVFRRGIELFEGSPDGWFRDWMRYTLLQGLGEALLQNGEFAEGESTILEALAQMRAMGDQRGMASLLRDLGEAARHQGDDARAKTYFEESMALASGVGSERGKAFAAQHLARIALARGDVGEATAFERQTLLLAQAAGDREMIAACLEGIARITAARHDLIQAARFMGAATALRDHIGCPVLPLEQNDRERLLADLQTSLGATAFTAAWEAGHAAPHRAIVAEALEMTAAP
jgi:predicted ATPase